jgi:hypothetical protein
MTVGYQHISNFGAWAFDCPDGTWTARLDQKAWGKSTNLMLFFTDTATDARYWFSVWHSSGYGPRKGGHDFKRDAEAGDLFELTTKHTKGGNPELTTARKLTPADHAPARAIVGQEEP